MSMISEAATTGKPVYTVNLGGAKPRHLKMQQNLRNRGIIRNFEGQIDEWTYEPLNDATLVANEIRRKSGLFQK
jgi:mitochondrial fission protein ELM1